MQAGAGDLADRVQPGEIRFTVMANAYATTLVMGGWHDRDWLLGDVDAVA